MPTYILVGYSAYQLCTSFKWKKMNVYIGISVFCVSSIKSCIFIIPKGPYLPQKIVCEHNITEEKGNPKPC